MITKVRMILLGRTQKVKNKFLITNDIGLSLDKVNEVISLIRTEGGFEYDHLDTIDGILIEVLAHLDQALNNLDDEEEK